ncbi:MAG: Glu-tRNA(Gln) amidotransferase subunit GatE [Candidatus Verstraetearchaeota archaeon]|nr:Glu-tRNA(Gln) amidotransferase subunit GatE [Candidatus Verstraetearchaeota archaeon]
MNLKEKEYVNMGLRVGLEIHQQLNTEHKLFCKCPTILKDEKPQIIIERKLRPTQSELGEIDPAALFEYRRGRKYIYEVYEDATCLVELDEEPPHELNPEALEIALKIALMLKAKPVDEVHVMRKIVIDGSNTTGFQRTAIIALDGEIEDEEGNIEVKTICLEEEAARKIEEKEDKVVYRLDRLGIPLIEIATTPNIKTPSQAKRVALKIGQIMRATGKVKRGIGTIRQDLNISIRDGARVEIKGVQELNLIPKIIENEVQRQRELLKIRDELVRRGLKSEEIKNEFIDVTDIFKETESKIILRKLRNGGRVYALKLPKFKGLLGWEIQPNRRLATEMSERAKFWARVGGIIHTDELPKYGITRKEMDELKTKLKANEMDAIVIVVDDEKKCIEALKAVADRAREALKGVPEETRAINPDGTTHYSRPMPGAARMYPETDVRPIVLTKEYLDKLRRELPEHPEETIRRYIENYKLSRKLAEEMLNSPRRMLFEKMVNEINVDPTLIASTLEYTLNMLKREGKNIEKIRDNHLKDIFKLIAKNSISKEAVPDILRWIADHPDKTVNEVVKELGLRKMTREEIERIVKIKIEENMNILKSRKEKAFGIIMGIVMREVKGKADGKTVNEIVREIIKKKLKTIQEN